MTISGTQTTAALPARTTAATSTDRAAATPASGDHGTAGLHQALTQLQSMGVNTSSAIAGGGGAIGAAMIGMPPYSSPLDRIQALLHDLMLAVRQLTSPIGQYPPIEPPYGPYPPIGPYDPYDPYDPYAPFPPVEPPHVGCPHMDDMPPIGPIDPMPPMPPATKKAPEVGDVLGSTVGSKGIPSGDIKVTSVHGTYGSRDKAVAAAKHLAGIYGNKPFGIAVSGVPGQEQYTVVGLRSEVPLKASQIANIVGGVNEGWALDTIAFSAKTAKRVQIGLPVGFPTPIVPLPPIMHKDRSTPPAPPAPPAPVPAPHTH